MQAEPGQKNQDKSRNWIKIRKTKQRRKPSKIPKRGMQTHNISNVTKLFQKFECTKGSSQKFAHRGQTKELSYGREGVWTRFVVRSTVKKKKKKKKNPRPSTDRAAALADKSKSPIKCRKSMRDLEQVQEKDGRCMHTAAINPSQISIHWRIQDFSEEGAPNGKHEYERSREARQLCTAWLKTSWGSGGRCKPPSGVWGSAPENFENQAFFSLTKWPFLTSFNKHESCRSEAMFY